MGISTAYYVYCDGETPSCDWLDVNKESEVAYETFCETKAQVVNNLRKMGWVFFRGRAYCPACHNHIVARRRNKEKGDDVDGV